MVKPDEKTIWLFMIDVKIAKDGLNFYFSFLFLFLFYFSFFDLFSIFRTRVRVK